MRKLTLILAVVLVAGGCRTAWMHPEASAQKYAADKFWCQHGYHRDERIAEHTAPKPLHKGWKQCLGSLGWESKTTFRGSSVYQRRDTEAARTMRETVPGRGRKVSEYQTAEWAGDGPRPKKTMYAKDAA